MYKVGDEVWKASCYWGGEYVPCPVCNGDKQVSVILGTGEVVETPCKCCKVGYSPPTGQVKCYKHIAEPKLHIITEVRITKRMIDTIVEYLADNSILYPDKIFGTKDEALEKCQELARSIELARIDDLRRKKSDGIEHAVYSIGYHKSEITSLKRKIADHETAMTMTNVEKHNK
jgi:hypothetical protein